MTEIIHLQGNLAIGTPEHILCFFQEISKFREKIHKIRNPFALPS